MTPQTPDLAAVMARLEKLETHNRWLRRVLLLALVGAVLLATQFQPSRAQLKEQVVDAQKFILRDDKGKVRAALQMFKEGPALTLHDPMEKARAALLIGKTGPALALLTPMEKPLIALEVDDVGVQNFRFKDANGKDRLNLGLSRTGMGFEIFDENGIKRALVAAETQKGTALEFFDEIGNRRVVLATEQRKGTVLELNDKDGAQRAVFGVNAKGSGVMELKSESGKHIVPR